MTGLFCSESATVAYQSFATGWLQGQSAWD